MSSSTMSKVDAPGLGSSLSVTVFRQHISLYSDAVSARDLDVGGNISVQNGKSFSIVRL
jgi:hypothetical protein